MHTKMGAKERHTLANKPYPQAQKEREREIHEGKMQNEICMPSKTNSDSHYGDTVRCSGEAHRGKDTKHTHRMGHRVSKTFKSSKRDS